MLLGRLEHRLVEGRALLDALRRRGRDLLEQHFLQAREGRAVEDAALVVGVLLEPLLFLGLDGAGTVIDVDAVAVEHANFDDRAGNARRQAQRGVANVRSLFAEDGAEELFLRRHRAFALRRDLAAQDVARLDLGADVDDARLVEVAERFLADVRDVAGDVFRPELGVAGHDLELFDVDRGEDVVLHDPLGDQDRVLIIVAVPRHERDEHVPAERELAELGRRTVGDDLAGVDRVTDLHQRALVDAGVLVRALELHQRVDVDAGFAGAKVAGDANDDTRRVDLVDHAGTAGGDRSAGIARDRLFHAGADQRRFGLEQRHRLALHVRAHERAVGVVVLEERDQRGGDRHQLLRADVHQGDLLARSHQEVAVAAGRDDLLDERVVLVQLGVGLGDRVLRLFHRREVDDVLRHLAVDDLAVRRFDEAVLVDPAEAGERVDQADVRAFRSLDRADAAIVGRVDVADFEARALAGETARPERRNATLVGHFGQRVGLVHELRQLRRAEEFAHRGDRRLGVDEVVRHDRRHVDASSCAPSPRAPCAAGRRDTGSRAARRPSGRGGWRDCRCRRSRPCRP